MNLPSMCHAAGRLFACALILMVPLTADAATVKLANGKPLPKDVSIPNDTVLAVYLPAGQLEQRFYLNNIGLWAEPGAALAIARDEEGQKIFSRVLAFDFGSDGEYGLLLDLDPKWSAEGGSLTLDLDFRVLSADGTEVLAGKRSHRAGINAGGAAGQFHAVARKAMAIVLSDLVTDLKPSAAKFPATARMSAVGPEQVVNRKAPVRTGTAFYINDTGQLLTAAHVVDDCLIAEGEKDGVRIPLTAGPQSRLLDLAVMDSGQPTSKALPLLAGQELMLGSSVTHVGYPLQGLLSGTPNLTRGNVSARGGLKGSSGIFQFSAPTQPGASGGPVVSDGGELLGVTVGTLNAAAMIKEGILPQNVNFALEARYVAMFLQRHGVPFAEVAPNPAGSMQVANDAALGAVVQLSCYQ